MDTARPGEPALIAVPGYHYTDVPGAATSEQAIVNSAPRAYKSASLHIVLRGGKRFAVLTLIQVKSPYANLPSVRQGIMSGLAKQMAGSGAKVTQETIHTEKVTIGRGSSITDYAWYHGGVAATVTGGTGSDLADFVEAYLKAAHA